MIWTTRRCISVLCGQLTKNTRRASKDKNMCTLNNGNMKHTVCKLKAFIVFLNIITVLLLRTYEYFTI
jgi:hypothetical protein